MKTIKTLLIVFAAAFSRLAFAQEMPSDIKIAIQNDDTVKLAAYITKDNVNNCYGNYSLLSNAIRENARKCFDLLLSRGADVNKICNGYVPPLMHAVKYGHLEMVKLLIAKGARTDFVYDGKLLLTHGPEKGETPLSCAEKYGYDDIIDYLQSLKATK